MNYTSLALNLGIQGSIHSEEYKARCPFHNDSSPSFYMNTKTGLAICHRGCFQGNFIQLVERVLGCNIQEAYEWIENNGRKTSVEDLSKEISYILTTGSLGNLLEEDKPWLTVYEFINNQTMPQWFLDRGFTWETINHWGIRYNSAVDSIVVPIFDETKTMVGTITRQHEAIPKYLNSHFKKSKILYGEISHSRSDIIIVEGLLDMIWLWQLGYNVVTSLGAFVSDEQVALLRKHRFGEVICGLDNDQAGKEGTQDLIQKLQKAGWLLPQITLLNYPGKPGEEGYKKDPQDCDQELFADIYRNRKGLLG